MLSGCIAIICRGPIGPQHIFAYTDVIRAWNWKTLFWNEITIDNLTKLYNRRTVMLMAFVQRMEMILRGQIDPTRCYEG